MKLMAHRITVACLWLFAALASSSSPGAANGGRPPVCLMYLTGQHDVIPSNEELIKPITHIALAFMRSDMFMDPHRSEWPLFRSVESARQAFALNSADILVAIGGWGDTGFEAAARNDTSRKTFAQNVARMVQATGADGVDIDWEYPGGNGEDYKQVPNSEKEWEIEAYPLLLGEIRSALGPDKLMTAAVPGIERDMIAFTQSTVPRIMKYLDFLNVMAYDLMNRRDNVTKHHTSIKASRDALQAYISRGAPVEQLNLGLGFYVKWFKADREDCAAAKTPVGCRTLLLEDPATGGDLGRAGGFSWHDEVPEDVKESFDRALLYNEYDEDEGATYYYDDEEAIWWTFDGPYSIQRKVKQLAGEMRLSGTFAWGLGEDAPDFTRLTSLLDVVNSTSLLGTINDLPKSVKDEL
ncbi:Chitinase 1 [Cytospora mali]|uniref:chitinase n=1 Tax=Cytospora mali TaxID=578113 RepID=A0A194W176_CYTMA|nr:Chitinase 1 [Valsa mali]